MFKGIRAQLFFGFGALVLVIGLFYTRLTFLFVDVTEEIVAAFVLEQRIDNSPRFSPSFDLSELAKRPFIVVNENQLDSLGELTSTLHDEELFRFETKGVRGYGLPIPTQKPPHWLLLNIDEALPLSPFTSVFGIFLACISAAAMLLAALGTWYIASRLSAPIRLLGHSVSRQRPDELCDINGTNREDEIGDLARAFSRTYTDLQDAWQREHEFANDVSHELRTPIALIRNTLALNTSNTLQTGDRQLLDQSTATLQNTVEVLLALARKENLVFDSQPLLPQIERTLLALHHLHPDQGFEVDVSVDDQLLVEGNANLIRLLCQNLINNSFYHGGGASGGGASMEVIQEGRTIIFRNPVLAPDASGNFENYQGLGHGQYLVKRMASVMGWQVSFEHNEQDYSVLVTPRLPDTIHS